MFQFRKATPADAELVAEFSEKTYRQTFASSNTEEDMEAYIASAFSPAIQLNELLDPRREILLAHSGDILAGYYQIIRDQAEKSVSDPAPTELMRIYVDLPWFGKGLSHQLMTLVLESARSAGAKTLWLGVWEKNERALAFYRKWNFKEVGSHIFVMGKDAQRDLILQLELSSSSAR